MTQHVGVPLATEKALRRNRCAWATTSSDSLMLQYHDTEWGVPVHNDRKLFEFLTLEGAQAGLSWTTVLNKRENYRKAFHKFDPARVAKYDNREVKRLMNDPGIIRNRLKISSTITNAKAVLALSKEFGSFDGYIWKFVNNRPIKHAFKSIREIPATTIESDSINRDLKKRGFRLVGSTICYAFMQAVGMVNDHTIRCFRYNEIS